MARKKSDEAIKSLDADGAFTCRDIANSWEAIGKMFKTGIIDHDLIKHDLLQYATKVDQMIKEGIAKPDEIELYNKIVEKYKTK